MIECSQLRSVLRLAMTGVFGCCLAGGALAAAQSATAAQAATAVRTASTARTYAGFDSNLYPGDDQLQRLRRSFDYAGYWLSPPPGATATTWRGKRELLEQHGFGFLVLYNGRLEKEIADFSRSHHGQPGNGISPPAALGAADAKLAVIAARREGFPAGTILFLDQEEGGRLTEPQTAYLFAWAKGVREGGFRAGAYCSGIPVLEGKGSITTAQDIVAKEKAAVAAEDAKAEIRTGKATAAQAKAGKAEDEAIALWVYNDACPPAPGCVVPPRMPEPGLSGMESAEVWQYAQSPQRRPIASACPGYNKADNNCYLPGVDRGAKAMGEPLLDLDTATSADPSHGRTGR